MIEKLFEEIRSKTLKYAEDKKLFGGEHFLVQNELRHIIGMEYAFEIIAGHSYTSHLIAKIDEELNKAM